ncbi:transcription initiation factor TAFII31, partial [Polychytrium aggregatum]|uniref:transcription initiation factor TAFII31 n=1 Tax=Polychytrium aggregatum TaxID=110093 RepID=UPI0022FDD3D6
PRDAKLVSLLLQAMDLDDYDPRVTTQLLEFIHRYTLDILADAQVFSDHARRSDIDKSDVQLAVQGLVTHSFVNLPSRDFLADLARKKNSIPLPPVPEKFGIRLPPEKYCLIGSKLQV